MSSLLPIITFIITYYYICHYIFITYFYYTIITYYCVAALLTPWH